VIELSNTNRQQDEFVDYVNNADLDKGVRMPERNMGRKD